MPENALTPKDIAQFAYNAGFRGEGLVIATAIAMAESGGRPQAMGDVGIQTGTWGPSVGLWQIRSLKAASQGSTRDQHVNTDPAANARHAFEISGGGKSFHPWSTYIYGNYQKFLGTAQQAAQGISSDATVNYQPDAGASGDTSGETSGGSGDTGGSQPLGLGGALEVVRNMLDTGGGTQVGQSEEVVGASGALS